MQIYFDWEVAESGYGWVNTTEVGGGDPITREKKPGRYLTTDFSIDVKTISLRRYRPLQEYTGLFRVFAETGPDPDAIKQFANRYGPLLGPNAAHIGLPHRPVAGGLRGGIGEPLSAWTNGILTMRPAVDLWDAARGGDVVKLGRYITWGENTDRKETYVLYDSHPDLKDREVPDAPYRRDIRIIVSSGRDEALFRHLIPGDIIRPTQILVQRIINENMQNQVAPRLLWNDDQSALRVYEVPKTLLGALWLQFAGAVERNSDFRKCSECGTWFELAPRTARSDKIFCSNVCRLRAFRRRRIDAANRHAAGRSPEATAADNRTDVETGQGRLHMNQPQSRRGRRKK